MTDGGHVSVRVAPPDWPLAGQLATVAEAAISRLDLARRLAVCDLVPDALVADDRAWLRLERADDRWRVAIWFHPAQIERDRPDRGGLQPEAQVWQLAPVPGAASPVSAEDFSAPNAQRFLYQQLLLVDDIVSGRLDPAAVPASLIEAFQEAWLITVDGRLQRRGLPHLSAAERRSAFLRLFAPAGIVTPGHWAIFNRLWDGSLEGQAEVLAKVCLLPPLGRRRLA